jgi:hypothetical protein
MDERRKSPRKRVLKSGKIIVGDKLMSIACTVRNVSGGGACLQLENQYCVPDHFEVVIDGVHRPCRVVWRSPARMGVAYQTPDERRAA